MKLLRAEFKNFRLLRDLEIEFSSSSDRNLTVIRAEVESGKTTIHHGLQWAFYGDTALPAKGDDFRLHPIDWDVEGAGNRVPITVTVEFELKTHRSVRGGLRESKRRFRLIRSATEPVDSKTSRSVSTVKLFELKDTGASPMTAPEAFINDELPLELRDVFFTDGDRALNFIEADVARATKRERVQRAIRSLLGLGVISDAIKHVKKSGSEVNKRVKKIGSDDELSGIASDYEDLENERDTCEANLEDAKLQFGAFDEKMNEMDRRITDALKQGDRDKLSQEFKDAKDTIKDLDNLLEKAEKEHSDLFRSESIATDLLTPMLSPAFIQLDQLRDQGKIPNTSMEHGIARRLSGR